MPIQHHLIYSKVIAVQIRQMFNTLTNITLSHQGVMLYKTLKRSSASLFFISLFCPWIKLPDTFTNGISRVMNSSFVNASMGSKVVEVF